MTSTEPPDDRGGARDTDPITSYIAANNIHAISALQRGTLTALRYADKYPQQCMTAFDVARQLGRDEARDSYSPRMRRLNRMGLIMYICKRPCANAAKKMVPMLAYRLRKPGDPKLMLSPYNQTLFTKTLAGYRDLMDDERAEFMKKCAGPITADHTLLLWRRMKEPEKAQFLEWINSPDRGMGGN
jgi:hypothetical protein